MPSSEDPAPEPPANPAHAFAELVPHIVWVARPDGSLEYVNRRWREYTGMTLAELEARGAARTTHPDDLKTTGAAWDKGVRTGEPYEFEFRFRRRDGTYRWHVARGQPERDAAGAVVRLVGTCTDVDDQRRSEGVLALQSRVLEAVALGVPLGEVLDRLAAGVEQLAEGLRCSVLLVDGDRLRDGAGPSLPAAYRAAVDGKRIGPAAGSCGTAAFRREPVVVEDIATDPLWDDYRHLALPHGLRACWSTPVFGRDGRLLATFAVYHDTPRAPFSHEQVLVAPAVHLAAVAVERGQDEAAVRAGEELNRRVLDAVPVGVCLVDRGGAVRTANARAAEFLGLSFDRLAGTYVHDFGRRTVREDGSEFPVAEYPVSRCLATGEAQPPVTMGVRRPDGETRWGVFTAAPAGSPAGGAVVTFLDVTERRRLEEQLRQAAKMEAVGRLAGGVAHDFNNLLTVINGFSELALESLAGDTVTRPLVEQVRTAGDRAAVLTRQLLAYGRKQLLHPQVLDLAALVADLGEMLRRLLGEDIELVLDPGPARAVADAGQVSQVVMNFAVNSRDAMPRGGRLWVRTAEADLGAGVVADGAEVRAGRYAVLEVADSGCGMTDEVKSRVFEPFFTTKGVGEGTGLGLATVYGIVKQSGGHVAVESAVGRGTTFRVYLPAVEEAAVLGERPLPATPARGSGTVLLVEDNDDVRSVALHALQRAGYAVVDAPSGEQALRAVAVHSVEPDVLVTDVVMPGMGGRELADRLTAVRPGLRVLFTSGYTDDAVVRNGVEQDAVHFLQKPYTPAVLAAKVREVLDAGR